MPWRVPPRVPGKLGVPQGVPFLILPQEKALSGALPFVSFRFSHRSPRTRANNCNLLENGESHSDPVCTNPVQNFPNYSPRTPCRATRCSPRTFHWFLLRALAGIMSCFEISFLQVQNNRRVSNVPQVHLPSKTKLNKNTLQKLNGPAIRNANRSDSRESIRRKRPIFIMFERFAQITSNLRFTIFSAPNGIRIKRVQFGNPQLMRIFVFLSFLSDRNLFTPSDRCAENTAIARKIERKPEISVEKVKKV